MLFSICIVTPYYPTMEATNLTEFVVGIQSHPGVWRLKDKCQCDPNCVSSSPQICINVSKFAKCLDRRFSCAINVHMCVFYAKSRFWIEKDLQKGSQKDSICSRALEKVARCLQCVLSLRLSCGLRIGSTKKWPFASRL